MRDGERRKYERYDINDLMIAVPNRDGSQVARIANISKGGLAVKYADDLGWLGEAKEIDIIVNGNFLLASIPIVEVDDFELGKDAVFTTIKERQTCVKFDGLSKNQKIIIEELIEICKRNK